MAPCAQSASTAGVAGSGVKAGSSLGAANTACSSPRRRPMAAANTA